MNESLDVHWSRDLEDELGGKENHLCRCSHICSVLWLCYSRWLDEEHSTFFDLQCLSYGTKIAARNSYNKLSFQTVPQPRRTAL